MKKQAEKLSFEKNDKVTKQQLDKAVFTLAKVTR